MLLLILIDKVLLFVCYRCIFHVWARFHIFQFERQIVDNFGLIFLITVEIFEQIFQKNEVLN